MSFGRKQNSRDKRSRDDYPTDYYQNERKESVTCDRIPNKRIKSMESGSCHSQFPISIEVTPNVSITTTQDDTAAPRKPGFTNFKFGSRLQNASSDQTLIQASTIDSAQLGEHQQLAETREFSLDDKTPMILALGDRINSDIASCEFVLRIIRRSYDGTLRYVEMSYKDYEKLVLHEAEINELMRWKRERQIFRTENVSVRTVKRHPNDICVSIRDRQAEMMRMNSWVFAKLLGLKNEIDREYYSFSKKIDCATTRLKFANNLIAYMLNEEKLSTSIELPVIKTKSEMRTFEAIKRTVDTLWRQLGKITSNQ